MEDSLLTTSGNANNYPVLFRLFQGSPCEELEFSYEKESQIFPVRNELVMMLNSMTKLNIFHLLYNPTVSFPMSPGPGGMEAHHLRWVLEDLVGQVTTVNHFRLQSELCMGPGSTIPAILTRFLRATTIRSFHFAVCRYNGEFNGVTYGEIYGEDMPFAYVPVSQHQAWNEHWDDDDGYRSPSYEQSPENSDDSDDISSDDDATAAEDTDNGVDIARNNSDETNVAPPQRHQPPPLECCKDAPCVTLARIPPRRYGTTSTYHKPILCWGWFVRRNH